LGPDGILLGNSNLPGRRRCTFPLLMVANKEAREKVGFTRIPDALL